MAKAWKTTGLRAGMSLRTVARRALGVRIAEFFSFAPFIHDPARVQELHDMRIAAKRLRYTLEIFMVTFPPAAGEVLDQVKNMQELLGEIHDADVLGDLLTERLATLARDDMAALVARLHTEADEAARLAAIKSHLDRREQDVRVGIAALLGRTIHRRRRRYGQFLDLWARLETRGFRGQLEALTRAPSIGTPALEAAASSAAL